MAGGSHKRRLGPLVVVRGLPGHPLHPPLTDATIGMYVLAAGLAVIGKAGGIELASAKGMWLALDGDGFPVTPLHARQLADPDLSPTTIADALHVSRSTLYATLPPNAEGIAAEIRRQRLQRAHTILSNPVNTQPIADIAAAVGIPSAAHFRRHLPSRVRPHPP
jgi:hypothetical protein